MKLSIFCQVPFVAQIWWMAHSAVLTTTTLSIHKFRRTATTPQYHVQQVDALYQGYGTHYVDLWCGTPAQRQTLIVVTGESPGASGFPCEECLDEYNENCSMEHTDKAFEQSKSSSFHKLDCNECLVGHCTTGGTQCDVGMSYSERSAWQGYEVMDRCYIGGPHDAPLSTKNQETEEGDDDEGEDFDPTHASFFAFDTKFACQTHVSGAFETQLADGILSMDASSSSFWSQMLSAGKMKDPVFSICFRKQLHADKIGNEAGSMSFGGYDARLHHTSLVMSQLDATNPNPSYGLMLRNVYLRIGSGGDSVLPLFSNYSDTLINISEEDLNHGHTVIDSGFTDTYLNPMLYEAFVNEWEQITGQPFRNSPLTMTMKELETLPTLLFQVHGDIAFNKKVQSATHKESFSTGLAIEMDLDHPYDVVIAFPPHHYMERGPPIGSHASRYIPRIYSNDGFAGQGTVLGANFMMGHDIVFDMEHKRLGWSESTCNYTELFDEFETFTATTMKSSNKDSGVRISNRVVAFVAATAILVLTIGFSLAAMHNRNDRPYQRVHPQQDHGELFQEPDGIFQTELELTESSTNEDAFLEYQPPLPHQLEPRRHEDNQTLSDEEQ